MPKPANRSRLRTVLGIAYFRLRRRLQWMTDGIRYAAERKEEPLPHLIFTHRTPLFRELAQTEMYLQVNKVTNLRLAASRIDGVVLRPGETFSYWKLIGKPTRSKGYLDGMILHRGRVTAGVGGGLCQLSNLIYWMTLHTPLQVTERYRHGYDVFPDSGRTQPFGSGATCFYNYLDLQLRNETESVYQLRLRLTDNELIGEWRSDLPALYRYEVFEKRHWITQELWGGYIRNNEIWRRRLSLDGECIVEEPVAENHAIMMYNPSLPGR